MARGVRDVGPPQKARGLTQRSRVALGVPNASGLAALPGGAFLVVDDDHGIYHADASGKARLAHAKSVRLGDLEGIAFDAARGRVVVVCEEGGAVVALLVKKQRGAFALGAPAKLGRLPAIGRAHNKGWEGIAWVPAGVFGPHETLLAVHEGKPKRLGVFAYPELETRALCELPAAGKKALCDLSDVAFESGTGRGS
ncbi:MAG: SdiA-regulated domain-containing protein [Myxococcales bacterium]|nr:SdiA-regulated domain-containing protein [Myxococcales bacterium]